MKSTVVYSLNTIAQLATTVLLMSSSLPVVIEKGKEEMVLMICLLYSGQVLVGRCSNIAKGPRHLRYQHL